MYLWVWRERCRICFGKTNTVTGRKVRKNYESSTAIVIHIFPKLCWVTHKRLLPLHFTQIWRSTVHTCLGSGSRDTCRTQKCSAYLPMLDFSAICWRFFKQIGGIMGNPYAHKPAKFGQDTMMYVKLVPKWLRRKAPFCHNPPLGRCWKQVLKRAVDRLPPPAVATADGRHDKNEEGIMSLIGVGSSLYIP